MSNENILVIDDEVDICFLLGGILKRKKFKTTYGNTISEGLIKLKACSPKYLFLDINLPDGSGLDTIKKVKELAPEVKIIMISAYDGTNERITAKQQGADAFVSKPFNGETIYKMLNELVPV